ncbi:MAG: STAS domain-containing protein [Solirubrobacteraceae bacterium]
MDDLKSSSRGLVVKRQAQGDRLVLTLCGELDLSSCARFEDELRSAEQAECSGRVVLDLSRLAFMDSAGLHVLLSAQERSGANGHELSLLRGPRAVQRMFELTDTDGVFRFDD